MSGAEGGLWGAATPYILAVYGIAAVGFGALIAQSLVELRRWSRRARELEAGKTGDGPKS